MARMIPSLISPSTKSVAERKIFEWFKKAEGTDDWVVFHSLGIAQHQTLIQGEVDFLVVAPKYGIFALEVKGGRVKRQDGMWYFTNHEGKTNSKSRGPFEQASDAMFSIKAAIDKKIDAQKDKAHKHIKNMLYGYGVMVPDIEYESMGIDEEPWMIFDVNNDNRVKEFIVNLSKENQKKWEKTYGQFNISKLPTKQDAKFLISILRSDFDKVLAIRARISNAEQQLLELKEHQYKCLDQIEDNCRAVIYGPAGTGKTLLAIEQAKRSVINGKKVALICFNSSISQWFQAYFREEAPEYAPAYIGTFHKLLLDITTEAASSITVPGNNEDRNRFYKEILPTNALEILLENPKEFDEIIVDEAQDLIRENYLDILDLILKKGFDRGSWRLFGDFSRQAIYADGLDGKTMFDMLENRTAFIKFKLSENCRNTKQICDEIEVITGYEASKDLWTKVEGLPVEHKVCKSDEEALEKLMALLNELDEKNIDNEKITILSPRIRENSIISQIKGIKIKDFSFKCTEELSFSTVQSFKGLENSVIILVDVDSYNAVNLMYVALSRARTTLYIFETKSAHTEYNQLQLRRLING